MWNVIEAYLDESEPLLMQRFAALANQRHKHVVLVTDHSGVGERGVVDGAERDRTLPGRREVARPARIPAGAALSIRVYRSRSMPRVHQ